MNEEIKKEFEEKFVKPVVKQVDANNSIVLPLWKNNHSHLSSDVWEWIETKLTQAKREGIEEFIEYLSDDIGRVEDHDEAMQVNARLQSYYEEQLADYLQESNQ